MNAVALILALAVAAPEAAERSGDAPAAGAIAKAVSHAPRPVAATQSADELPSSPDVDAARARASLERGLLWLAAQQRAQHDGTFPRAGGRTWVPVPLAALGALAFMSAGSAPERGPYGAEVAAAIDYLLAHADMNATSVTRGYIASDGDSLSRLHGHGFATVALAMAWTESTKSARGERLRDVLGAATALIERSQGLEGGWYYAPTSTVEHENSVTVVLLQALRSARNVGISVDARVIARAVDYVGRCQSENGAFRYTLDRSSQTSIALTAAGITTLDAAGRYDGSEVQRALVSLWQQLEGRDADHPLGGVKFPHYERLYVALALWARRDTRAFERWWKDERTQLLVEQDADGSWSDDQFGACYATAMNCIVLALPQQLLPLFER